MPPPPHELPRVLGELEHFTHSTGVRPLVKSGLVHVQFETIHPFLDGNGRLGRLLITLLLCAQGTLAQPFLYLGLFFKQHRANYHDALQRVRVDGDFDTRPDVARLSARCRTKAVLEPVVAFIGTSERVVFGETSFASKE